MYQLLLLAATLITIATIITAAFVSIAGVIKLICMWEDR